MSFKMPERRSVDGGIVVRRCGDAYDSIVINATHDGKESSLVVTDYNAIRIFGALAFLLAIKLPAALMKEIKF